MIVASALVAFEALVVLLAEAVARLRSDLRESALLAGSFTVWAAPTVVTVVAVLLLGWPASPALTVLVSILIPAGLGSALMWRGDSEPVAVAVAVVAATLGLFV